MGDYFEIYVNYPNFRDTSRSVFQDVINIRTSTNQLFFAKVISDYQVFGRTFKNVRFTEHYNQKVRLWFNTPEGIVAFRDEIGKLWRFDRVE